MKKANALCLAVMTALAMTLYPQSAQAQDEVDEFGIFDHVSAGLVIGTTGIGIDVAAPITEYLQVRAGYNFFPTFKYKEDIDYRAKGKKERGKTEAEGKSHFSTGHFLVDVYPFPDYSFHATAGFYFGTDEVATIENLIPVKDFEPGEGIVIGDYIVGFDQFVQALCRLRLRTFRSPQTLWHQRRLRRTVLGQAQSV